MNTSRCSSLLDPLESRVFLSTTPIAQTDDDGVAQTSRGAVYIHRGAAGHPSLWITDGTVAGAHLLRDIAPASPSGYAIVNSTGTTAYFLYANDQLWVTDGTPAGTYFLRNVGALFTGAFAFNGRFLFGDGGVLYSTLRTAASTRVLGEVDMKIHRFGAKAVSYRGSNLYITDGFSSQKIDVLGTNTNYKLTSVYRYQNKYFVTASRQTGLTQPFLYYMVTDAGAVTPIQSLPSGDGVSVTDVIHTAAGQNFFLNRDAAHGLEVWLYTNDDLGTAHLVKDINPGAGDSSPLRMIAIGNVVYFIAYDGAHGTEVWRSDGTTAGTYMLDDVTPGAAGSEIRAISAVRGHIIAEIGPAADLTYSIYRFDEAAPPDPPPPPAVPIPPILRMARIHSTSGSIGRDIFASRRHIELTDAGEFDQILLA